MRSLTQSRKNCADALLIHGWSQSQLCWARQVAGGLAEDFHLVTFDSRGHGMSEKPTEAGHYLDAFDDFEDRVPATLRDARTEGSCLVHVPPPGGVIVRVIGVRATDVRRAVLPTDAECAEHLRLAAFDCRLNRLGKDVALSHHPLWRAEHSARGAVARLGRWLPGA